MAGNLRHRVEPQAPLDERGKPMSGNVMLRIVINKEGKVVGAQGEKGRPEMVVAAIEAVEQWTYQPYLLNGEPVEVETWVTVKIKSSHRAATSS
jgi:protein TonB